MDGAGWVEEAPIRFVTSVPEPIQVKEVEAMRCGGWTVHGACGPEEDLEAVALASEFKHQVLAAFAAPGGREGEGEGESTDEGKGRSTSSGGVALETTRVPGAAGSDGWRVVRSERSSQVVAGTNERIRIVVDLAARGRADLAEMVLQRFLPLPCNVAEGDAVPGWRLVRVEPVAIDADHPGGVPP